MTSSHGERVGASWLKTIADMGPDQRTVKSSKFIQSSPPPRLERHVYVFVQYGRGDRNSFLGELVWLRSEVTLDVEPNKSVIVGHAFSMIPTVKGRQKAARLAL